jgi:hypothetical protein
VPFFSEVPDPDSDVVVTLSLRTYRLVCLRCSLSKGDRTETHTCDAMLQHLDEHRAAGHRVPDSFYDGLIDQRDHGLDDQIRTIYAWSGREEDGNLSVSGTTSGDSLCCLSCVLNEKNTVECFTTDQMMEHLDEHRTWGLFVADHVYEGLERDRSDNDQIIQRYFDEHGFRRPATPRWEPHSIYPEFTQSTTRYEILGQLAAMLVIAIRRFVEPLTDSELSAGWTQSCSDAIVVGLRAVLGKVEAAHRDQGFDFRLMKDMQRIRRRPYDGGVRGRFDQRTSALDHVSSFIDMRLVGRERMLEWLTAAAESGRAIRGEQESGMKWIGVRDWEDLEDF